MKPSFDDLMECSREELAQIASDCIGLIALAFGGNIMLSDTAIAPGHTDLMVSPEEIDRYLEENPPHRPYDTDAREGGADE